MDRKFKTLVTKQDVDLIPYIKQYITENPGTELLIGCDSQNRREYSIYAIVIAMYRPGKGAHVLYCRYLEPRHRENVSRLLGEVWASVEVAEYLLANDLPRAKYIDIDLNPDPRFKSNEAFRAAVGLVEGMGYKVRHKGLSPVMTYAADHLVK
jgi:predicted RNase H-related nuclease YkuK (DUF458 family)